MRAQLARIATHIRASTPLPEARGEAFLYGVAQPFLGLRVLLITPLLRRRAALPALAVLALAALTALGQLAGHGGSFLEGLRRYYAAIVSLASLPAVLFAKTYARLVADAFATLGFGVGVPLKTRFLERLKHLIRQALLLALAMAPLYTLLRVVPFTRGVLVVAASAVWTLHWIVVEALDEARVEEPAGEGGGGGEAVAAAGEAPRPWFVGWTAASLFDRAPGRLARRPVRWFGRVVSRLARPWAEETALVRQNLPLALGFGLATAALLAVPVANLLLRPAILVGAVHLRGRLAEAQATRSTRKRTLPSGSVAALTASPR